MSELRKRQEQGEPRMLRESTLNAWTEKGVEKGKMGRTIYDFGFRLQNDSLLWSCLLEPGQNGLWRGSPGGLCRADLPVAV